MTACLVMSLSKVVLCIHLDPVPSIHSTIKSYGMQHYMTTAIQSPLKELF